jgi:hypothetical protein
LEGLFLAIYFISLPYIVGLAFLYSYIAKGSIDIFLLLSEKSPFLLIWAIGYEFVAIVALFIIAITYSPSKTTNSF